MSRHYEKSKPLSDTLLIAGRYLFGGLSALFLLLCALSIISQVVRPGQDSWFFLAITAAPLLALGLVCASACKSAGRGSRNMYWLGPAPLRLRLSR